MAGGGSLIVVGTGIQWAGQTTLAARRAIEQAERVLFAVADPGAAHWVRTLSPGAEPLPYPTDPGPRRRVYAGMVERVLVELRAGKRVCAVFYGHPGVLAFPAHEAVRQARREGFAARMLPGVSSLDCLYADLEIDPGDEGCQAFEATDFLLRGRVFDPRSPLVLLQIGAIGNRDVFDPDDVARIQRGLTVLGEVLAATYPPAHPLTIYEASTHPVEPPRIERLSLAALGHASASALSTLYVPPREQGPIDATMMARLGMDLSSTSRRAAAGS